jgi:hypothetical protein
LRTANILHVWAFRILDDIVVLYIGIIGCCAILFPVIWLIPVAIPVKPINGVRNDFRCAILLAFDWMTVDSPDLMEI